MNYSLSVLSLVRSPLKTLMTFVLLVVTSFAFASRGVEYVQVANQVAAAEASYTAIGTLQMTTERYLEQSQFSNWDGLAVEAISSEAVGIVRSSRYVNKSEIRYVAGGTTSKEYAGVYENPLGVFRDSCNTFEMDQGAVIVTCHGNGEKDYESRPAYIKVTVEKVVAGNQYLFPTGEDLLLTPKLGETFFILNNDDLYNELKEHHRYFLVLMTSPFESPTSEYKCLSEYVDYPIVDLTRLEEEHGTSDYAEALHDPEKYGLVPITVPSEDDVAQYYCNDVFLPTLDLLEILDRNTHTSEIVYTSDMDNLMRYHDNSMYIVEGRAITTEDTENVCVISADYALQNGISLGENIEFTVNADTMVCLGKIYGREIPNPTGYFIDELNSNLGIEPVTQSFKVIGLWSDSINERESDPFSYSLNTVFVPSVFYPWTDSVEPRLYPSTFSFMLKRPCDASEIEKVFGDVLAEGGYEFIIDDGGYSHVGSNLSQMEQSALISFIGMSIALLLALILITYLFISRKKKDYAIMRALGTPITQANRSLLKALLVLSTLAVAIGDAIACCVAQKAVLKSAVEVAKITGTEITVSNTWASILVFAVGTLALIFVFGHVELAKMGRITPLTLLQSK